MRWFYLGIIILFATATLLFGIQNRELVTIEFLGFSARAPLAIMIAIFYVLGAITGGTLYGLLRKSARQSKFTAGATTSPA
jgi:putative membrane protein